jgi:hypothetical protein
LQTERRCWRPSFASLEEAIQIPLQLRLDWERLAAQVWLICVVLGIDENVLGEIGAEIQQIRQAFEFLTPQATLLLSPVVIIFSIPLS